MNGMQKMDLWLNLNFLKYSKSHHWEISSVLRVPAKPCYQIQIKKFLPFITKSVVDFINEMKLIQES